MAYKILITPRSFSQSSEVARQMLLDKGYELLNNPYDRIMSKEEMKELIKDVDGVILGVDPFDKEIIQAAEKLKVISRYGVGLDNIDIDYAKQLDIPVLRTVGANSDAVADYAFGLMLDLTRKITFIDKECRKGNWKKIKTSEMNNKIIGIIGLGAIGKGVAKRALGFDMNVLAFDLFKDDDYAKANHVKYTDLETIYKTADFISIHLPLNEDTHHMIDYKEFEMMKKTTILVNTARGGIVNEDALYDALKNHKIMAAGVDVFETEPPKNLMLMELDNLIVGAHCAASSNEAIDNMSLMAAQNLIKALA
ncbi:MAG: hydroxyacid dehydrogenase [Firmicutes bacterium HGW-Firmicutes-1]|jgi:D-3-phosphoglycerate dehydrogenase|nr:MAG: hydroxyacid dehydrogenase [Firmicutes bacterium HGW-Firmicutes-1]